MASGSSSNCGDVIMWKRPWLVSLVLLCGTYVYYECAVRNRSIVSLISNILLFVFLGVRSLGIHCRRRNDVLPIDLSRFELSSEAANQIVAFFANTVGATEGVLRVAASGSDFKLFTKVVLVLYTTSAVGRAAAGGTVAYLALWIIFTLPICLSMLAPDATKGKLLHRRGSEVAKSAKTAHRIR